MITPEDECELLLGSQVSLVDSELCCPQSQWDIGVAGPSSMSTVAYCDKVTRIAISFSEVFVHKFEQEESAISQEAEPGSKVSKKGKISGYLSATSDVVPSALPATIVGFFSSKYHMKKAKSFSASVTPLKRGNMRKVLVESALEIVKNFEELFVKILSPDDDSFESNITKLAVDAVFRSIYYLSHNHKKKEVRYLVDHITKGVILGESKKNAFEAAASLLNLRDFQGGFQICDQQRNIIYATSSVYSKTGIRKVEDGTIKFYKLTQNRLSEKYGYRFPFQWEIEEWEDIKHKYSASEKPERGYVRILNNEKCERLVDVVLEKIAENDQVKKKDITEMLEKVSNLHVNEDKVEFFFNLDYGPGYLVRRERILKELRMSRMALIVGKHGTGKSQLAKFHGRNGDFTKVMLIDCGTYEAFSCSILKLAKRLGISTEKRVSQTVTQDIDTESLIKSIYNLFKNAESLFIFDNITEYEEITKFLPCNFTEIFSDGRKPCVLMTSCNKNSRWDKGIKTIDLDDGFSLGEAVLFIEMVLEINDKSQNPYLVQLAEALNYLPLALVQATAHIREKKLSISQYLECYNKAIQSSNPSCLEEQGISSALYSTLKVNFDEIKGEKNTGSQSYSILYCMAYLDPNQIDIKETLLQKKSRITKQEVSSALALLNKFSMVKLEESLARIHAGVQKTIREEIRAEKGQDGVEETLREIMMSLHSASKCHVASVWSYACTYNSLINEFIGCTYGGSTILHLLAKDGNNRLIEMILERVDSHKLSTVINTFDKKTFTPLEYAIINGHLEVIKCLIRKGADVNLQDENGVSPMHFAAIGCNLKTIVCLKEEGADVNLKDKIGMTPVHFAAASGNLEVVKYFKQIGKNINLKNTRGMTCIHFAAVSGSLETVKYLKEFADISLRDNHGMGCIHFAAFNSHLEIIEYLVQEGIDINLRDKNGMSCLHWAVAKGELDVSKYLIQKGADVNLQDQNGVSPMHFAAFTNDSRIVKYLKENGANISLQDKNGISPMHWAALNGNLEIVKYLEENDANVSLQDQNGINPMHWATLSDDLETIKYLKERIADVDLKDKNTTKYIHWIPESNNLRSLKYIIQKVVDVNQSDVNELWKESSTRFMQLATKSGKLNIVKSLVEVGINVNLRDKKGMTCMHWAARNCSLSIVKYLAEMGTDINLQDKNGMTPVFWAIMSFNLEIVRYLVRRGTDINLQDQNGMSPMHWAARGRSSNIVEYLVEVGGDINLQDKSGNSPMHWVVTFSSLQSVKYLVQEKGADVNLQNKNGTNPIHWAAKDGNFSVFKYLVAKGTDVNLQDKCGMSYMHWAIQGARSDVIKHFVKTRSNIIEHLVKKGADINLRDENGMNIFEYASSGCSSKPSYQELTWYLKKAYPTQMQSRKRCLGSPNQLAPPKKGKFENVSITSEKNIPGTQLLQGSQDNVDMLSDISVKYEGISGKVENMVDEITLSLLNDTTVETFFELDRKQSNGR